MDHREEGVLLRQGVQGVPGVDHGARLRLPDRLRRLGAELERPAEAVLLRDGTEGVIIIIIIISIIMVIIIVVSIITNMLCYYYHCYYYY